MKGTEKTLNNISSNNKQTLISEIKNSLLQEGNVDSNNGVNNKMHSINTKQENGIENVNGIANNSSSDANPFDKQDNTSAKDAKFPANNISNLASVTNSKESSPPIPRSKKSEIPATSNFIMIEENLTLNKNHLDNRSSSNGKVQDFKNEFLNLFDSDRKEVKKNKNNSNVNKVPSQNHIPNAKKIKNISLFESLPPKNENSNRTVARRDKPLSFVENEHKYNNISNVSNAAGTTKDKIRSFVTNIEKEIIVKDPGKNKSPSSMKDYFSPSIKPNKNKNANATLEYLSNSITGGKNKHNIGNNDSVLGIGSTKSKMNNYLTLLSPKEINLYSKDKETIATTTTTKSKILDNYQFSTNLRSGIHGGNSNIHSSSNNNFKVDEVKNLTSKLKFLTEREIKKLDTQYLNELKNLANVINKLFK